ncbi:D-methionine transport system substrate-binding protein [Halanaerobium saccharolyticum]|uniref:Lipoprotein n=1 Tax=Halanaerobium saccharolyticum TaxID=43595 RepID=A0A4R7YTC9_9FIRM|nr:MetQ/NlpA family ABC transporter substrate-binding protein [Halanaerobium saccharolyticum]RAK06510.1 D-methionine transport system substrate-binding protein [Halanaerobium saccharolyticum]TDW01054.1 D-methionine transport system substrate-binding protein [Halanaerobium saccharolyticum]TDX52635.1 D-methionine transport system substrate-binding protein [Halanaerobium saccharolyticum]
MKKTIKSIFISSGVVLAVTLYLFLAANTAVAADPVLKVGATAGPFAQILEAVKPVLAEDGVELEIIEFSDYVTPNLALEDGSLDANTFQHIPYFERFTSDRDLDLVSVAKTIIIPIAIYSDKYESLSELPAGSTIAIPNDPTNGGRALLLFEKAGLIELDESAGISATIMDITSNPKNLEFHEVEAAQTARVIPDVAAAAVNSNYALELGMNPREDSIYIEDEDSPYVCIVAVRPEDKNDPLIEKFIAAYQSETVRNFINEKFNGSVIPAF